MSFSQEELETHCKTIMISRRVKNKVVVLCEGDVSKYEGRRSPQKYRKLEQWPDSNFYRACVPEDWTQYVPQFFNCGDRKDVLDTFFTLSDWHSEPVADSHLDPAKLFAIVDLDIQIQEIEDYGFSDTEKIFYDLYDGMNVNVGNAARHRIWGTGLIHKEAYFLLPELQEVFDNFRNPPTYNDAPLRLEDIYLAMSDAITGDTDLHNNLQRACDRIRYCSDLDCTGTGRLRESWSERFQNVQDDTQKDELIFALLTIRKAKAYWNQIGTADDEWTRPVGDFRDALMLKIAHFYSETGKSGNNPKYHIPFFLKHCASLSN